MVPPLPPPWRKETGDGEMRPAIASDVDVELRGRCSPSEDDVREMVENEEGHAKRSEPDSKARFGWERESGRSRAKREIASSLPARIPWVDLRLRYPWFPRVLPPIEDNDSMWGCAGPEIYKIKIIPEKEFNEEKSSG